MNSLDIFLSYAKEDRATAERLVEVFRREGWEVFWDRAIPIGKSWDEVLDERLPAARAITALWSPDSVTSRWVRTEADVGMERQKLFPAMIRPAAVPISFRLVQYADLSTWNGESTDHGELQRLLDALRRHLSAEPARESHAEPGLPPLAKPPAHPVFLGYARDDRAKAEALVQALERSGLPVWWDFTIPVGESFESSIQQALESSQAVLILWSARGLRSEWVRAEAEWALRQKKLVGVKVEPVSLAPEFGDAPSIDLSGWTGSRSDPEFVRLLQNLPDVSGSARQRFRKEPETPAPRDQQSVSRKGLLPLAAFLGGLLALGLAGWFVWTKGPEKMVLVLGMVLLGAMPWLNYLKPLRWHLRPEDFNPAPIFNAVATICTVVLSYFYYDSSDPAELLVLRLRWLLPLFVVPVAVYLALFMAYRSSVKEGTRKWPLMAALLVYVILFCSLAVIAGNLGLRRTYKFVWGEVVDVRGKGVEGAAVAFEGEEDLPVRGETAADGSFRVAVNRKAKLDRLLVHKEGFERYERQIGGTPEPLYRIVLRRQEAIQ